MTVLVLVLVSAPGFVGVLVFVVAHGWLPAWQRRPLRASANGQAQIPAGRGVAMRVVFGAVALAAVACGSSTVGSGDIAMATPAGPADAGSPETSGAPADAGVGGVTQPQMFAVALGVSGAGEIDGLGDACTNTCVRQVPQGSVELRAVAAQGFVFDHWSVACAGPLCSLAVTSDLSVTATFVPQAAQPPPLPVLRTLTVTVVGQGRVTSNPAGVDCRGVCTLTYKDGTLISLFATPDPRMLFSGFSGACAGQNCLLTLSGDASVTATFAIDDCAGLMPDARLPPPLVPFMACNGGCNGGTSDDGAGNFMLHEFAFDGVTDGYVFVVLSNGTLQPGAGWFFSPGQTVAAFSEPSGFTLGEESRVFREAFETITLNDNGLVETNEAILTGNGETKVLIAPDPSGGFVALRSIPEGAGFTETSWQRFDSSSFATSSILPIASERATTAVAAAGVTISGSTLVETHVSLPSGTVSVERQWIRSDGALLTDPFGFIDSAVDHSYQPLLDGSLLERSGNAFTRIWNDGHTAPSGLPSWLASRSLGSWLAPIRGGAGYAMAGTCGGLEVLSKSGRSCGCMPVSGLSAQSSIGRDGSLIVPRTDHFEIYPLLFHR